MEQKQIYPERITKPIQLLAAWLVGLLTVDGAFLLAVSKMDLTAWQSGALTVAAIINVPLFICALFLLQTKFRPELQEDSYYSTYLNNRTDERMKLPKRDMMIEQLTSKIQQLETLLKQRTTGDGVPELSALSYGVNVQLDNAHAIESELDNLGVPFIGIFGEHTGKPDKLVVAVAKHLPKDVINQVLLLAKRTGFEYFNYIEPFEQTEEDVLFGAYGEPAGKITIKEPTTA